MALDCLFYMHRLPEVNLLFILRAICHYSDNCITLSFYALPKSQRNKMEEKTVNLVLWMVRQIGSFIESPYSV